MTWMPSIQSFCYHIEEVLRVSGLAVHVMACRYDNRVWVEISWPYNQRVEHFFPEEMFREDYQDLSELERMVGELIHIVLNQHSRTCNRTPPKLPKTALERILEKDWV